ncbi:MAG: cyclase [Anaerolineaceae bacterium]|nr:cyclase [Anaerolineaceae bacterium]
MTILQQLAAEIASGAILTIDLTQTLSPDTPTLVLPPEFNQCAGFSKEEISRYDERGVAWYWNNFTVSEHTGTHFDAPVHWASGKDLPNNSTNTIPPADFLASAVVIDISQQSAADPDYLLTVADIEAWEEAHGCIPPRNWVLLRTDWSKREGEAYTNRHEDGAHTPGPTTEAVRFLLEQRDIHGLGVETIGTDAGQAHLLDPAYPAHTLIHGAGRYGLQCLENLDLLPATGSIIVAAPLKIEDGSGSPLRVLALVAD